MTRADEMPPSIAQPIPAEGPSAGASCLGLGLARWTIRLTGLWPETRRLAHWMEDHALRAAREASMDRVFLQVDKTGFRPARRFEEAVGPAPPCPRLAEFCRRHGVRRMRLDSRLESHQIADVLVLLYAWRRHLGPDGPVGRDGAAHRLYGPEPVHVARTETRIIDGQLDVAPSYCATRFSSALRRFAREHSRFHDHRALFAAAPKAALAAAATMAGVFVMYALFDNWWLMLVVSVLAAAGLFVLTYLFFMTAGGLEYDNEEKARRLSEAIRGLQRYADRTQQDLQRARFIQHELLPDLSAVTLDGRIAWASRFLPETEVGGDYFDVARIGPDQIALLFVDVSGHGMAAAFITAIIKTAFQAWTDDGGHVEEFVLRTNRNLRRLTPEGNFAALFVATCNAATGRLTYLNCGHYPEPWHVPAAADRKVQALCDARSMVLGVEDDIGLKRASIDLSDGDRIVLVTDGLVEARNAEDEMFSPERFAGLLEAHRDMPAGELVDFAVRSVEDFAQDTQYDDRTILVMHMNRVGAER